MINPAIFIGEPLIFKNRIFIYPPRVKDVVNNPNYGIFNKILTMTEEDVRDEIKDKMKEGERFPSPFEYLILSCQYVSGFDILFSSAIQFFCKTNVQFLYDNGKIALEVPKELSFSQGMEMFEISEENFFDFQNALREACGDKLEKAPEPIDPNEDPRIRRIKDLARKRDKIKAKSAGKNGISLTTCMVAICCMGIGVTPLNIGEMSYASIGEIMKMMQEKEKYDIDIRSLLAGADSKKIKPKYWIRNL